MAWPQAPATWTVSDGSGSVSSSGLYTAPAAVPAQATTVKATSTSNSAISGTATVTLVPLSISAVTPATVTLYGGRTQQFSATVTNNTNSAIT